MTVNGGALEGTGHSVGAQERRPSLPHRPFLGLSLPPSPTPPPPKEGYTLLAAHPSHLNCPTPASRALEKPSPDHTPDQRGSSEGGTPCQALGKLQLQAYSKEEVLPLHPAVLTSHPCLSVPLGLSLPSPSPTCPQVQPG